MVLNPAANSRMNESSKKILCLKVNKDFYFAFRAFSKNMCWSHTLYGQKYVDTHAFHQHVIAENPLGSAIIAYTLLGKLSTIFWMLDAGISFNLATRALTLIYSNALRDYSVATEYMHVATQ